MMTRTDRRRFPILFAAIAALAVAGAVLASLFSTAEAESETTNFYLWRTTMTVGQSSSGDLGYDKSDAYGSLSTGRKFGYAPWNPPHKHHVDRGSYYTVETISYYVDQGNSILQVEIEDGTEIANGPGNVTLWLNNQSVELRPNVLYTDGNGWELGSQNDWVPNMGRRRPGLVPEGVRHSAAAGGLVRSERRFVRAEEAK